MGVNDFVFAMKTYERMASSGCMIQGGNND